MIINITLTDIWKEFIYWRSVGNKKMAFEYIRREHNTQYFEALVAAIAYRRYPGTIRVGDTVKLENKFLFKWDEQLAHALVDCEPSVAAHIAARVWN